MQKRHTKEQYELAFSLRNQKIEHKKIMQIVGVTRGTLSNWFYLGRKPHIISEKWKIRNKTTVKNLGEKAIRKRIYPSNLSKAERAYFLGAYLGDGNSYKGFDMQVKDKDFATYVATLLSKICNRKLKVKYYERKRYWGIEKGYRIRTHSLALKDWLEKSTSNKKKIPSLKSRKGIFWFLSAFIDSEGSIKKNGRGMGTNVRIELSQKDESILLQIQIILLKIGIKSRVSNDGKYYYRLYIYSKINFEKIIREGNLQIPYKIAKLEFAIKNGNRGFIRGVRK